ncbi:MAG: nuclear transport factor 2 family protein [Actinomycetota bacterium]
MSQENVEVVREAVDAVNRGDSDAFIACLRPDVEWEESGDVLPGLRGVHRGWAEVRKWFDEAVLELWESLHLEVEEITDARDGCVFLELVMTTRGRASGVETQLRFWQVFWLTDGKVARRQRFGARDEALAAARLRE